MNWLQGTPRTVKPRSAYRSCRRSRPAYCGVRPHFEATLTMSTALPRYWPRSADPPRRPPISTSKTDMGPILGDGAPPRPAPCWLDRPAGTGRAPGPGPRAGAAASRSQGVHERRELVARLPELAECVVDHVGRVRGRTQQVEDDERDRHIAEVLLHTYAV